MKKNEVKVGGVYVAKVSDKLTTVRIDSAHSRQGWNATNTATGKRIHIKSAQRLRRPAKAAPAPKSAASQGRPDAKQTARAIQPAAKAPDAGPKPTAGASKPTDQKPAAKSADKPKRVSALDAAAEVLCKAGKPMRSQEMIAAMAEQGLWKNPGGKTPHATLYAAILREIGNKGDKARFKKVDRGQFAFSSNAK